MLAQKVTHEVFKWSFHHFLNNFCFFDGRDYHYPPRGTGSQIHEFMGSRARKCKARVYRACCLREETCLKSFHRRCSLLGIRHLVCLFNDWSRILKSFSVCTKPAYLLVTGTAKMRVPSHSLLKIASVKQTSSESKIRLRTTIPVSIIDEYQYVGVSIINEYPRAQPRRAKIKSKKIHARSTYEQPSTSINWSLTCIQLFRELAWCLVELAFLPSLPSKSCTIQHRLLKTVNKNPLVRRSNSYYEKTLSVGTS
jgi:hypothetical protein